MYAITVNLRARGSDWGILEGERLKWKEKWEHGPTNCTCVSGEVTGRK